MKLPQEHWEGIPGLHEPTRGGVVSAAKTLSATSLSGVGLFPSFSVLAFLMAGSQQGKSWRASLKP